MLAGLLPHNLDSINFDDLNIEASEVAFGERPIGFRFSPHIINIKARILGREIIATGEATLPDLALVKARAELIERETLLHHGTRYGAGTSNGWAAYTNESLAKLRATLELVERDATLAHWYSSTPFFELPQAQWPKDIQSWAASELSRSEFPIMRILISSIGLGPSVTCLFLNNNGFGVSAHSSRASLEESIESAIAEACRPAMSAIRREHWGSAMKLKNGCGDQAALEAHGVYYAYHEAFPRWMFGKSLNWAEALTHWGDLLTKLHSRSKEFKFTVVRRSPLVVGFTKHSRAFPLRWGNTDAELIASLPAFKRLGIDKTEINKNVHIIA